MGFLSELAGMFLIKTFEKTYEGMKRSGMAERVGLLSPTPPPFVIQGDYTSGLSSSIQYRFRFYDDGTYLYMVEEVGVWQLAHRGRFHVTAGSNPIYPTERKLPPLLTLEPTHIDVMPLKEFAMHARGLLEDRGLPLDKIEEYTVIEDQYDRNTFTLSRNINHKMAPMNEARNFSLTKVG